MIEWYDGNVVYGGRYMHLYTHYKPYRSRASIVSTTVQGCAVQRVLLLKVLHAFFERHVEGLDRGRLTRVKAQSALFFAPCHMSLSA